MRNRRVIVLGIFVGLVTALAAPAQLPKDHWTKGAGNRVHYYDIGKGKDALILIHGWNCNADFWKDSYNAFPRYHVIAIDLPGYGKSDKPQTDYSMEYFARGIDAVMADAKVKRAVLVGHSMGTPVARQFYRLYPEKTLGIVVVDGPLVAFGTKAEMDQFLGPLVSNYKESAPKFLDGLLGAVKDETLRASIRSKMSTASDYVAISAMQGMIDDRIWTNDKINVPVLAIMAAGPFLKPDTQATYKAVAPDLDFEAWTGVSHFLFMEKPKEFNASVAAFVKKHKLLP
jgi:pimeloyl-ACP methyl ester carboxylesterase